MRRRLFAGVSIGLLALGMGVVAAPARAALPDASKSLGLSAVVCAGEVGNTYSPGLDFTPNPTDLVIHEEVTCTSLLPLGRIGGKMDYEYTIDAGSCVQLLQTGQASLKMNWSDGTTSVFDVTVSSNMVGGQNIVTQTGTVASGRYAGSTVVREITGVVDLNQCSQPGGVSERTSAITMTILL